jgi:hypothetical protein
MSTVTAPARLFDIPRAPAREPSERSGPARSPSSDGGRLTLEERLHRVWEGLSAAGVAPCPLCGGGMERQGGQAGRCRNCGSRLS